MRKSYVFAIALLTAAAVCEAQITYTQFPAGGPVGVTAGTDGNLWYTEGSVSGSHIGKMTTAGVVALFAIPGGNSEGDITMGPDGNLWFPEYRTQKIGRITTAGVITEFPIPTAGYPHGIAAGPDGNLWFTEPIGNNVGRITPAGIVTEYPVTSPWGIAAGRDGNLWFTENASNRIGRITTAGVITEFSIPTSASYPVGIAVGPDGNLWFAEELGNKIGRITPAGVITEFSIPPGSGPVGITVGPDGNLWFSTDGLRIGRITTVGVIADFPVPTVGSGFIALGPDGNLWATDYYGNQILKITLLTGPDPTITKVHNGSFRQGDVGDNYTITVTNLGQTATSGEMEMVDALPNGLTAVSLLGPDEWSCSVSILTCSTSNALPGGASAVFTLIVNVAANAPASVANTAHVTGGGDTDPNNNTASEITPITQVADLIIAKTHSGQFIQGQLGRYTISVKNVGAGPTVGTVNVTDTLPAGLGVSSMSGPGWSCNTSTATCARSNALAANASYPAITLTALVGNAAASVTNTAQVSGGGEINTANDSTNDPTSILQTERVTVTPSPANLIIEVDGTLLIGSHTFTWFVGDVHTISTSSPQGSLTFKNWSEGGAILHNITVSPSMTMYTAVFQ